MSINNNINNNHINTTAIISEKEREREKEMNGWIRQLIVNYGINSNNIKSLKIMVHLIMKFN